MGCSPSRGNGLHGAQGAFRRGRTLLPGTHETQSDDGSSGESCGRDTERDNSTVRNNTSSTSLGRKFSTAEPEGAASAKLGTQEITIDILSQEKERQEEKREACEKKGAKKSKKAPKGVKLNRKKEKERKLFSEEKVDFPETLVKAHQAAYAYLNPSISKYEDLLGLLDHAAQTQISLQPMVAFMVLCYEEINKGLQEIVEEGEMMLKENGAHLAWPCEKKNSSSPNSTKNVTSHTCSEPPPDLLQQLLQYTVQRMRQVGQSVCGIGDTALEEAVDYFSSIIEILDEKLRTKRASESRLMRLLSRIEAASQKKPGPEDSALFSEDSGLGAESESLAGSDRQRQRRESCDSTGTICAASSSPCGSTPVHRGSYRGRLLKTISNSSSLNSTDSTCTIAEKEQRDTESLLGSVFLDEGGGDDVEDGNEEEKCKDKRSKQTDSFIPDRRQPQRLPSKRIENPQNIEMTLKLKDAISGRIRFLPSQGPGEKAKQADNPNSCSQWTEDGDKSSKRPQTAASKTSKKKTTVTKRSRSADSLRNKVEDPTLTELERTQKELNQRLEGMTKVKCEGNTKLGSSKRIQQPQTQTISSVAADRQRSLNRNIFSPSNQRKACNAKVEQKGVKEEMEEKKKKDKGKGKEKDKKTPPVKGPLKVIPVPSPPPSPRLSSGLYRERNSVKKLIDTFSQGLEESKQSPESVQILGPLKGVRKCGVPIIPGLGPSATLAFSGNSMLSSQGESQCSERTEDLDIDNLPPPPLEVLMDNSFENAQTKDMGENVTCRGRSTLRKRTAMSQRLRASLQSVTVLPSKGNLCKSSVSMSPVRSTHQDTRGLVKGGHHDSSYETDTESEEAACLYKQARKIIHLRHSSDSPTEKPTTEQGHRQLSSCQGDIEISQKENNTNETVPNNACKNQTPATPTASRTRVLPSTPLLHRRLPSPPVLKSQASSSTSSSPPVVRKLPTPLSAGQRTLPSTPATRQDHTPITVTGVTYPFKAPSPPASPKVHRWSKENSGEDSSRVFSNARSVFCPVSSSLFEAQPVSTPKPPQAWVSSGSSVLPRPWGERGRLPISARGPQPFIRRSQSDRRPSLSLPSRVPVISVAETCGSEPAISTHGLEDGPVREDKPWNEQTEIRGAIRSVSHPDLCIVGQGLQKEWEK
ncbi:Photoreceptor cilium actin regulator [Labeo rohita]|uniref:Photoreceptor cilium actin regulator n=1 Tax=Labeo rohita TaxID=84645 RepID=A0ABQ8LW47_LABRO|nr:photoreceptor cilium actin regulator [Labeo rohita]KAI2654614.1 Photoreceptor cilium actin regulator [Labeo rohita]